jgi:VWFA-related protein
LFDRYAQSGETGQLTFRDARAFVSLLGSVGRNWISAGPPAERERRRDLVALLALETARSAPRYLGYFDGLVMIEWACDLLREDAQTEFERQWMLASSSLLLRSYYEYHYVYGPEGYRGGPSAIRHLDHALSRFPREPRLRLTKILLRPEAYALSSRPGADPDDLVTVPQTKRLAGQPGLKRIGQTIEALGELVDEDNVGAEARTHVGWLQFHVGDVPASREAFTRAARTATDPFVRNLAWLGVGLSLDAEDRRTEATDAYRAAVEAMPRARASAVQLAAHLFLAGKRSEASQLVGSAYGPDALDLEPWRHVIAFDRLVPDDLRRLRGAVALPNQPDGRASGEPPRLSPSARLPPSAPAEDRSVSQRPGTLRARANAVVLNVLVASDRRPVIDLAGSDFEVTDNGERQVVEVERADTVPLDISLVIDSFNEIVVGSGRGAEIASPVVSARTRQDLLSVAGVVAPDDRLRVLQVDGNVAAEIWSLQPPPFPVDRLPGRQWGSLPKYTNPLDFAEASATYGRMQALYDVVTAALLHESPSDRRHLVVVFTDGVDGASVIPPKLLLDVARESDAVMYLARRDTQTEIASKVRNKEATPYGMLLWPPDPQVIEQATVNTGGSIYYRPLGSLLPPFKEMFDRFRRSYILRYQPTNPASGWHDVTIRITRPGRYDVRARRGYTVSAEGGPGEPARRRSPKGGFSNATGDDAILAGVCPSSRSSSASSSGCTTRSTSRGISMRSIRRSMGSSISTAIRSPATSRPGTRSI